MPRAVAPARAVRRALQGGLLTPGDRVVVAVSGGADSVFLLLALHAMNGRWALDLRVAHLDHGWRGSQGEADADWVATLAERLGLPLLRRRVDAPGESRRLELSPEEGARRLRYAFLRDACREFGASAVATGHTADDQIETALLALLRGSGPAGVGAMRPSAPLPAPDSAGLRLVRPLLTVDGGAVREALREAGQDWREDASNGDLSLPRNRLRATLLPLLAEVAPGYRRTVPRAVALAAQAADYLRQEGARAAGALFRADGEALVADRSGLLALHPALRGEALRWAVATLHAAGPGAVPGAVPEWAHVQGALEAAQRGRGGAVAWLAPGVRLRLERGRVVVEPVPAAVPPGAGKAHT